MTQMTGGGVHTGAFGGIPFEELMAERFGGDVEVWNRSFQKVLGAVVAAVRRRFNDTRLAEDSADTALRTFIRRVREGFDLRLMPWGDGSGVPASGKSLVVVGTDHNGLLHVRIFDAEGNRIEDTDEAQLPAQATAIAALKQQLPGLLPPHVLTDAEREHVIAEATSIVGRTLRSRLRKAMAAQLDALVGALEESFKTELGRAIVRPIVLKMYGDKSVGNDEDIARGANCSVRTVGRIRREIEPKLGPLLEEGRRAIREVADELRGDQA